MQRGIPLTAVVVAALVLAPAAPAAEVIGQTSPTAGNCMPGSELQETVAGPPSYTVPAGGGVIVSWSTYENAGADHLKRLKVYRRTGVTTDFFTVGHSSVEVQTPSALNTFATRVPVQAGDILGLTTFTLSADCDFPAAPGDAERGRGGDPALESTVTFGAATGNLRVNVSAVLEPDADNDGFGDETQDGCPTLGSTQGECVAPDTQITKGPKDKGKKKKASFEFSAGEEGATFECSLDGGAFAACALPHLVKVKKGKHNFQVRATDAAGNVDGSPASDDWKVKKKKK